MRRDDLAIAIRALDADHALTAARVPREVGEGAPLAKAVRRRDEKRLRVVHDIETHDAVALAQADAANARCRAPHPPHIRRREAHRPSVLGEHQHVVGGLHEPHGDEFVALLDVDRPDARLVDVLVVAQERLLDRAQARREEDVDVALERADRQELQDLLALLQIEEVDERPPETRARRLRDLIRPLHEEPPRVREEHELVVRLGDEDEADEILLLDLAALHAVAAAPLLLILGERHALDVAAVGERDDARLVGDEILDGDLVRVRDDLRPARGVLAPRVALLQVGEVGADDRVDLLGIREDRLVGGDGREFLGELGGEPVAFEADELVEAHLKDGVHLQVRKAELRLQRRLRLVARLGGADDAHDLVEVVDGEEEAVQNVLARLGLREVEARPPRDDLEAVADVGGEVVLQVEDLRAASHDGEQARAERRLQLRVLVEVVEDDLADGVALQVDDDADVVLRQLPAERRLRVGRALLVLRVAAGDVADVADALDDLLLDELGHVLDHLGLVDPVGDLGDDDLLAPVLLGDDLGLAAHGHLAAAEFIHRVDAVLAADRRARREVGALDEPHELVDGAGVAVLDVEVDAVAELAQVVRRDVRRHAHGDAGRAVQEEVRQLRGEDGRLLERLVVVGHHVDRVLLQVVQELAGRLLHAHLRVAHRGGRVAVDRAEVAVAVDEREAQGEVLGEADDRVVDGRVAVRVVFTDDVADDARGLDVLRVPAATDLVHREQAPAVDGLQAVADVGQRAADDDAHRIVDVVTRHLVGDIDLFF